MLDKLGNPSLSSLFLHLEKLEFSSASTEAGHEPNLWLCNPPGPTLPLSLQPSCIMHIALHLLKTLDWPNLTLSGATSQRVMMMMCLPHDEHAKST
jgi:hypothetical protein